jgi:1-acyl-sn-glycerol-3-phosphate acyltransferase
VTALRAGVPFVPCAGVGAEEAQPIFAQVGAFQKLTRLSYFPMRPTFPWLGALAGLTFLPAKFTIRFLEPIRTDDMGDAPWEDTGLVQEVAQEIRARIQEELFDMLAKRKSVWLG